MKRPESLNQSVKRAVTILEYLAAADTPRDLANISQDLKLNKSTTFRFLSSLAAEGYVRRQPDDGRYFLGPKVSWLATRFLEQLEIRKLARPILEELAHTTGETIHLAILDGHQVSYIDKVEGRASMQMTSRVGYRMPIHSTALGKVLLAGAERADWVCYADEVGFRRFTANTIVTRAAFFQELVRVREQGYAIDNVENEEGIRCVAAPIFDHQGQVVAAASISGWTLTMTPRRTQTLIPVLRESMLAISRQLGYVAPAVPARAHARGKKTQIQARS